MQRWIIPIDNRIALAMVTAAASLAAPAAAGSAAVEKLAADCRLEGEAGGLAGAALESYIVGCVEDLQTVEIHNTEPGR
jgi:hypothetical protein